MSKSKFAIANEEAFRDAPDTVEEVVVEETVLPTEEELVESFSLESKDCKTVGEVQALIGRVNSARYDRRRMAEKADKDTNLFGWSGPLVKLSSQLERSISSLSYNHVYILHTEGGMIGILNADSLQEWLANVDNNQPVSISRVTIWHKTV